MAQEEASSQQRSERGESNRGCPGDQGLDGKEARKGLVFYSEKGAMGRF